MENKYSVKQQALTEGTQWGEYSGEAAVPGEHQWFLNMSEGSIVYNKPF